MFTSDTITNEEKQSKRFINDNADFFSDDPLILRSLHVPPWAFKIFEKHFVIIDLFFKSQNIPKPKIVKIQFKFSSWRIYFDHEPKLTSLLSIHFLKLVDDLAEELEKGMLCWKKTGFVVI